MTDGKYKSVCSLSAGRYFSTYVIEDSYGKKSPFSFESIDEANNYITERLSKNQDPMSVYMDWDKMTEVLRNS